MESHVEELRRLEERKKKRRVVENAARFFGFLDLLEREDFRLRNNNLFLLSRELGELLDELPKSLLEKLVIAGIKAGEIGRRFRFSLEGAFFLPKKEKKRVYVDGKAEMLFLYGRDVFSSSIESVSGDVIENDTVFVCNRYRDVIGLGMARFDAKDIKKKGERIAVKNLVDRGEYLRKKKQYVSL